MTDNVTPTQADRDVAESILGEMAMGNEKRAQLVAARHRLDAIATQDAEIARLRGLVEAAYKEGFGDGWGGGNKTRSETWEASKTRKALEQKP